jgi:hypothetical protein
MPDYRKPPVTSSRPEPSPAPSDSINFSIETTTMRLKSLKLRRAEAADRDLDEQLRATSGEPEKKSPVRSEWDGPAGRVRHDERGMAVWDWAVASGEFAALSATNVMRKLDVGDLKIEETQRAVKAMEAPSRNAGGGGDPYNQRKNEAETYNPYNPHGKAPPAALPGGDPYNTRGAPKAAGTIKRPPPAPAKKTGSVLDQLMGSKKK